MKPSLIWGKGRRTKPAANLPGKAARIAKALHHRVRYERTLASSTAREKYLRNLMGLSSTPARDLDKERGQ